MTHPNDHAAPSPHTSTAASDSPPRTYKTVTGKQVLADLEAAEDRAALRNPNFDENGQLSEAYLAHIAANPDELPDHEEVDYVEEYGNPEPPGRCTRAIPRQGTSAVAYVGEEPDEDDPLLAFEPYLHARPRGNSITPERQRKFIATLAATGIVQQAARSIGKSMEALYKLRARPGAEGFREAWEAALDRGVQRLEDCALERAIQGTPTPIVSGGKLLGEWDKPDNMLLRFLLRYRLPQRYGAQQLQPGDAVYERIREEVMQDYRDNGPTPADSMAQLEKMFEAKRKQRLAQEARELEAFPELRRMTAAQWEAEKAGASAEEVAALGHTAFERISDWHAHLVDDAMEATVAMYREREGRALDTPAGEVGSEKVTPAEEGMTAGAP